MRMIVALGHGLHQGEDQQARDAFIERASLVGAAAAGRGGPLRLLRPVVQLAAERAAGPGAGCRAAKTYEPPGPLGEQAAEGAGRGRADLAARPTPAALA